MGKRMEPRKGDIFMAELSRDPLNRKSGRRPVLIVQNNVGNVNSGSVIVVIVTASRKKQLPTHVPLHPRHGLKRDSIVLCEHIITIEKSCLMNFMGTTINTEAMRKIDEALKVSLGLKE